MNTIKLYQQDVYLQTCTSQITSMDQDLVVLDQTVFFPIGGGQSCDTGTVNSIPVTEVYEQDHVIYHKVADADQFQVGQKVTCQIDWSRRFDNMQRHCGEHILSGIFFGEYGGVNRGFHMGEDYMTIDINLEEDPAVQEITREMAEKAERKANEVVWSNAPVSVFHFDTHDQAAQMPLRKALAIDEEISVVCVGDINNASDCVACCGTHPSTAGQVGLIKIYKVEHYKGMFRIYFEAGKRAFMDYSQKHQLIQTLGKQYSAGTDDLLDKIKSRQAKNKEVKQELYELKQAVIKERTARLLVKLQDAHGQTVVTEEYSDLKVDDSLTIGRALIPEIKKLLFIVCPKESTILLLSNGKSTDCGKLVKENASIYNGKGGGNATSARAIFPKPEYLDTFMDLIEKPLR